MALLPKGVSDFVNTVKENDTGGYPVNPPLTNTASSHAITIKTASGLKIGRIQSWNLNLNRIIDTIYEVNLANYGEPIERAPQIQNTNSVGVERYELYTFHIGEAFGVPIMGSGTDLVNLTLQAKPINVREIWRDPFGVMRAYVYVGCYFSNLGRTISATDDRIIKARATLEFTRRLRLL